MLQVFHRLLRLTYPHKDIFEIKRKYQIPNEISLQVRVTPEGWLVATSPDLPGLVTEAPSQQELIEMVNDSVLTYFDVPKKDADIVFDNFNLNGEVIKYQGKLRTRALA